MQIFASRTLKSRRTSSGLEVTTWNFRKIVDIPFFVTAVSFWLFFGGLGMKAVVSFDDPGLVASSRVFVGVLSGLWLFGGLICFGDQYLKTFSTVKCVADRAGIQILRVAPFYKKAITFPWSDITWVTHTLTSGRLYGGLAVVCEKKEYVIDDFLETKLAEQAAAFLEELRLDSLKEDR